MTVTKQLPRIVGLTVLTGAGVLAQQGVAHASVAMDAATQGSAVSVGTPGSHIEVLAQKYGAKSVTPKADTTSNTKDSAANTPAQTQTQTQAQSDPQTQTVSTSSTNSCVASDAFKTVTYTVDGKTVTTLAGNVKQGSKVDVNFVLNDNCDQTQVGLAAYQAPGSTFDINKVDQQVLVGHQGGTYAADGKTNTLTVTAPDCDFQVDFFTGPVLTNLTKTNDYNIPNGNLVDAANGGTDTCVTPPPPPPVTKDSCPTDESAQIVSYSWTINGVKGFKTLAGNVKPGDKVEVDFVVAGGCDNEEVSLASYSAPSDTFDLSTVDQQVLVDSATGRFGPGEHVLDVNVAACYYQVDFVHGGVLTTLTPDHTYNIPAGNLIEAANGGEACTPPPPPPQPPTQVEAEQITQPQLAFTGVDSSELAMIGSGLTLMGAALERAAYRLRKKVGK